MTKAHSDSHAFDSLCAAVGRTQAQISQNLALMKQPNAFTTSFEGVQALLEAIQQSLALAMADSTTIPSVAPVTVETLERRLRTAIAATLSELVDPDPVLLQQYEQQPYLSDEAWDLLCEHSNITGLLTELNEEQTALTERLRLGLVRCGLPLSASNPPDLIVDMAIALITALRSVSTSTVPVAVSPAESTTSESQLAERLARAQDQQAWLESQLDSLLGQLNNALGHMDYPWDWVQLLQQAKETREELLRLRTLLAQHDSMHAAVQKLYSEISSGQTFTTMGIRQRLRAVLDAAGGPTSRSESPVVRHTIELEDELARFKRSYTYHREVLVAIAEAAGILEPADAGADDIVREVRLMADLVAEYAPDALNSPQGEVAS